MSAPTAAPLAPGASPRPADDDPHYKWRVLVSVVFGVFMVILDTTVVNVAFPTLRAEFGASLATAQWIVSVYVLALGVATPLAGFLADRFGMKRIYVLGLALFAAGSLLAGLSPSFSLLVTARALQGIGGGLATPLGSAFLFATFPPREQGTALGFFGIALLLAPAIGPILGGALVDHGLWRWIFFLNLPIGALGITLASRFLRERRSHRPPALDVWGLVLAVVGFGAMLYAASSAEVRGWTDPLVLGSFLVGIASLGAFTAVELRRETDPLLELRLFRNRTFLTASVIGYVSVWALFGAEFLMPLYLQTLRGTDAFRTGLILLPLAVTAGITTPVAGRLYDRIGPRALVVFGYAVLIVNTWQLSRLAGDTSLRWIMVLMAMRGLALGSVVQSTFTTALGTARRDRVARASSLVNSTRFVVQSIGVAALATVLASAQSPATRAFAGHLQERRATGSTPPGLCGAVGGTLPAAMRSACVENLHGYGQAYTITFAAAVLAFLIALLLPGWPGEWSGRAGLQGERRADSAPAGGIHLRRL